MVTELDNVSPVCRHVADRLRAVLLAFCGIAVASLVVIYLVAPAIYVQTLMLTPDTADTHPLVTSLSMVAIALFVTALAIGILRRWRWLFWLVLVVFMLSALQIVAFPFELAGIVPPHIPAWYALFRALVAVMQLGIGLWMIRTYRRCGVWGLGRAPAQAGT